MKKIVILILTGIVISNSIAQQSFSLKQSIDYAFENAISIKNATLDYDISKAKVKETTAIGLPQINGKWDAMYNFDVQKQFMPANVFNPAAPEDLVVPVGFGLDYSSNASITATQLIFDGSYLVGLQAAKVYKELAEHGIAKSKEDIVVNVSKAYYLVLITMDRVKQIEENQLLLDKLLEDTKLLAEGGFAESIDTKRVTVNINNLKAELQKIKSFETVATNLLKFQMGMKISENLILTDKLDDKVAEMTKTIASPNYANRAEYQMLSVQDRLNKLNLKNEKIALLPSLAAFGTLGANVGANKGEDVFKFNDYESYSMIGISLNVPIWSSGQRKHRISQAKSEVVKTTNNLEMLQNSIDLESAQSQSNLNNTIETLDVRTENVDLATEVYEISKFKYEQGVGSSFEVTSAQTDLKTAQTEYYNALYDAIIAKIELDKANGSLEIGN